MTETKRPQTLQEHIDAKRVVKVTAAGFNGKEFDGAPLVLVGNHNDAPTPEWIINALKTKEIEIGTPGSTDYASFGVRQDNSVTWAGPGDYIIAHAVAKTFTQYIVVPHRLLDMMEVTDIEALSLLLMSIDRLKYTAINPNVIADKVSRVSSHSYEQRKHTPLADAVGTVTQPPADSFQKMFENNIAEYSKRYEKLVSEQFPPAGDTDHPYPDPENPRV